MNSHVRINVALLALFCFSCSLLNALQAAEKEARLGLGDALKQISTYKYGQSRKPLIAVADYVRDSYGNLQERENLRNMLAALLSSDATADCKRFLCKQLSIIGTSQDVPVLARLLTDEELSHMARFALERIPGPAADAALRHALPIVKGKTLVGVINSIGVRRDSRAVPSLSKLLTDTDAQVAAAAASSLGKIGSVEAAGVLSQAREKASPELRPIIADASLQCADRLLAQGKKEEAAKIYRELSAPSVPEQVRQAARRALAASRQR